MISLHYYFFIVKGRCLFYCMLSLLEMEFCVCNKMGETTDVDKGKLFVQMRMQGVEMSERSNASIVV